MSAEVKEEGRKGRKKRKEEKEGRKGRKKRKEEKEGRKARQHQRDSSPGCVVEGRARNQRGEAAGGSLLV